ncbi:hypothetical protein GCM10010191_52820 [Actinomadura vinacea]|uniref:Clp R domain-containing protein n=1 Tax=Actinomadura vinacea TaxID=115336 RepID=A0ABN3JJT2_9ACTN
MSEVDRMLQGIIERAGEEARRDGAAAIEVGHLLLAIAADPDPTTREILASVGLDEQGAREALEREFEHSLDVVGVSASAFDLPPPSPAPKPPTRVGASFKLALERAIACCPRKRDLRPAHLLLGILQAEVGTVPRALELAGIDRSDIRERVGRALGE